MDRIYYFTNADTEVITMRSVWEGLPEGFPDLIVRRTSEYRSLVNEAAASGSRAIVVARLLGGEDTQLIAKEIGLWAKTIGGMFIAFPGEATFDEELASMSEIPGGSYKYALEYLIKGGLENFSNFLLFLADTLFGYGFGFEEPKIVPNSGVYFSHTSSDPLAPKAVVVFYRAHLISSNTRFIHDLVDKMVLLGMSVDAYFCYSLRSSPNDQGLTPAGEIQGLNPDVIVTTVLASGSFDDEELTWDAGEMSRIGVPILQALVSTNTQASWAESDFGLGPMDIAMSVAIPEFDGRIISVPFSFKEVVDDDLHFGTAISAYRTSDHGTSSVAGQAYRLARLRHKANSEKKVAIVLSAYPTRRSRLGNAVGLDTPQSAVDLLIQLRQAGYQTGEFPTDPVLLMELLGELVDYDSTEVLPQGSYEVTWPVKDYLNEFSKMSLKVQEAVTRSWGEAPGEAFIAQEKIHFPALKFGNIMVAIQPSRGFGENPIAIYHSAELVPMHHYMAFYRFLDVEFQADAVVHLGKHGTLEWLPGKSVGLSADCYPQVALGDVPFIYPFVVNDPGEGTQAKRRTHGTIIDHMVPPLTRAGSYGSTTQLEDLLDEHQKLTALDPSKLPRIREHIWRLLEENRIDQDLSLNLPAGGFSDPDFDSMVSHIDGYLCELKDAIIRGGLHILGKPPEGDLLIDTVSAITRVSQGNVASLRGSMARSIGLDPGSSSLRDSDLVDQATLEVLRELSDHNWPIGGLERFDGSELGEVISWICGSLVPRIQQTTDEMGSIINALAGGFVEPGPSGAPSRGMAHVLPTGRNFYSIDPRAIPSRLSYEVGTKLADSLVKRFVEDKGRYPKSVGVVIWGTAAMRTGGDDISQVLALLGVRPTWDQDSSRVSGLDVISLEELGRPRVDVTCRISGFFRDAFPQAIKLLDEAFELVARLDEMVEANPLVDSLSTARVFGPPPRAYGSGLLPLLISKDWRGDEDLAEVYLNWSGFSYSRSGFGVPARDELSKRLKVTEVASKNQDNREHDIFDSDDYMQDHGGMIAAIRTLSAKDPLAYFGDSSSVENPRVRSLEEEAARVFRSRVVNPKWISAMMRHGYKGAFEMAATADYLFGYQATARVVKDWMFDTLTKSYVADEQVSEFFRLNNPDALASICERLIEASSRGLWQAADVDLQLLRRKLMEVEGWKE